MPFIVLDIATAKAAPVTTIGDPLVGGSGETLGSLRTELAAQFAGRTDVDAPRMNKWVNWAYMDFASSVDLEDFRGSLAITLDVDQPLYVLPPVVSHIDFVAVVDPTTYGDLGGRKLKKTDKRAYRMAPNETEEPHSFFRERNLLVIYPTPKASRVIVVDFRIRPQYMVDDPDQPLGGWEWHEGLVTFARSKGFKATLEFDKAMVERNEWNDFVRRKLDTRSGEDDQRIVTSSVPRSRRELQSQPTLRNRDGLY